MSKYATHNWYTLAFDADKVAEIIPEDYEYKNGKVWGGYDLSQAIEWMRQYNEHGRTLFRVAVSVEAVDIEGVNAPQPCPVKPWHEYHGNDKVHMPNSESVSVEVGLPMSYTAEERAKMIELRVIDDVRSVYGWETADFVTRCFHQHEAEFDTEKMTDRPTTGWGRMKRDLMDWMNDYAEIHDPDVNLRRPPHRASLAYFLACKITGEPIATEEDAAVKPEPAALCRCGHPESDHYKYILNGAETWSCKSCDPTSGLAGDQELSDDAWEQRMAADHPYEPTRPDRAATVGALHRED